MLSTKPIVFAIAASLATTGVAAQGQCPKWERGALYPWQPDAVQAGDKFAWLQLDVDKTGYPFRCTVLKHNYPDPEQAFWVCKNYRERWRAPAAAVADPTDRVFKRLALIASYDRVAAERKARRAWFKDHPDERPGCYPERVRPDRLDW